jgi:hypothetical protein
VTAYLVYVLGGRIRKIAAIAAALFVAGFLFWYKFLGAICWSANPILVLAWYLYRFRGARRPTLIVALISLVWMSSFPTLRAFPVFLLPGGMPIIERGADFWLWLASAAAMALCVGAEMLAASCQRRRPVPALRASGDRPSASQPEVIPPEVTEH